MAPTSFPFLTKEERERRRASALPLALPPTPNQPRQPSPLQRASSLSISGPRPLPRSQAFPNLRQFVRSNSTSSSNSTSTSSSEMSRTPTNANAGLGIDLGSEGRGDGRRDGSQRKQVTPVGERTRGLHGPRELTSMRGSAERTPRSAVPVNSTFSPPPPSQQSLPPVLAPAPLFSSVDQVSVEEARSAALAALTMAERVGAPASVTAALRQQLRVIPSDEERLYPPPTMAPGDVGKTNAQLMGDIQEMLNNGQTRSMLDALAEPLELSEEEKERRRLKNKKKNAGRKAKKAASGGAGGGSGGKEEEGAGVDEEKDLTTPDVVQSGGFAKSSYTTPNAASRSINRQRHLESLGYGSGTGSPTPTSRQPVQLQSNSSPSPPAYTPTRTLQLSTSGFSIASPRQDTPRSDTTPRQVQANIGTPRKPVESSPVPDSAADPFETEEEEPGPVRFIQYVVQVPSPEGPAPENPAPAIYCYRLIGKAESFPADFIQKQVDRPNNCERAPLYFFDDERVLLKAVAEYRLAEELESGNCEDCRVAKYCEDCKDYWFAFYELKAMPATYTPEERKRIIDGNRSLRNIRTELDNLIENNTISNEVYDFMMNKLPAETPLNGSRPTPSRDTSAVESPPAYNTPTAPSLPSRETTRPEISRVVALYPYTANDSNDCTFVVNDEIIVYEKVNDDWWMGKNVRSGKEGVFPASYTNPKSTGAPIPFQGGAAKTQPYGGYQAQNQQQYQQQTPYQPSPSQSYNAPSQPSKGSEMGKKAGKKLGNAALFGAGATVGSKIVNCIF